MKRLQYLRTVLVGGASALAIVHPASAKLFDVPGGDLSDALGSYMQQSRTSIFFVDDAVRGHKSPGAKGNYTEMAALTQLLRGSGFTAQAMPASNAVDIVPQKELRVAEAGPRAPTKSPGSGNVETVVVTAEKKQEDIQTVPIAVTALSQQQLTQRQVAGGPDLVKEVPNLTFSKTNFTGYNIEIRGIGTQAISVTTDPAVAVAFNGIPFIRNHFFEQEFYDLDNLEVLRGPQGTLYGRNATAGVVNILSAKPSDQFEAMGSADIGNYNNRRFEAMVNIPIVDDKIDLRVAGEWTKRDGYSTNSLSNSSIDGRDLWSGRASLRWRPNSDLDVNLVWEHFQEDDDRLRSGKQLCETAQPPTSVNGVPVPPGSLSIAGAVGLGADYLSQGCEATSLYSPNAFQVPYGFSLPYAVALGVIGVANPSVDPYASTTQSRNLRSIESALNPHYQAKNDTLELNADYTLTPTLTLSSQTGYNQDYLWSVEDYNRFNTSPGIFCATCFSGGGGGLSEGEESVRHAISSDGTFCDPQLGCSNRLVAEDLSNEHSWQLSQEFRLGTDFSGPLNFNLGGNYLHYETEENYYVFINSLSLFAVDGGDQAAAIDGSSPYIPGVTDNHQCVQTSNGANGYQAPNPFLGGGQPTSTCIYMDPNPIGSLNNKGHNYFLSQNPYTLNSYAAFGEAYYQITRDLKLTGGLRWTEDLKHFTDIPSEVITRGYGYPVTGVVNQQWNELTGRAAANWAPKLDFTDQTLFYASYARGYKAGGANPPGAVLNEIGFLAPTISEPIHPLTFRPEFVDAFELGTKNTLLDGALTLNADVFYYAYKDYQVSEIVDRTSINQNFNATVKGAELETTWEPTPGLKFSFAGGYEDARVANGQSAIDLMDRTAGMPGWMVVKPIVTASSNCILPNYVVAALLQEGVSRGITNFNFDWVDAGTSNACEEAYIQHLDPATLEPYVANPSGTGGVGYLNGNASLFPIPPGYAGFDPTTAPNNGEGFAKNLTGHSLPSAPPFTASFTAEYTMPVSQTWAATLHGDFYWQADSWARVFNDNPYDRIHGYTNLNLSLILNSADGWQVMAYAKNVFNTTAITGDFLNSDDSGLTTNVFLTDPRLFGVRVTKRFDEGDAPWGGGTLLSDLFANTDNGKPALWIELGGQAETVTGQGSAFAPAFLAANPTSAVLWNGTSPLQAQKPPEFSFGEEAKVSYQPEGWDWIFTASIRFGRSGKFKEVDHQTKSVRYPIYKSGAPLHKYPETVAVFSDTQAHYRESHAILDFSAGRDVGMGIFGREITSELSLGVRFAQFNSDASFDLRARPDLQFKYYPSASAPTNVRLPYFHNYHATGHAKRDFHGIGPSISWDTSEPLVGNLQDGEVTFDLGANAGVLFGKQRTRVGHHETANYASPAGFQNGHYTQSYDHTGGHHTNRSVTVPNLGGFAGVSYRVENAKISLGYRADFFFDAIDGGIDTPRSQTLGFKGPFAKISIGLGG